MENTKLIDSQPDYFFIQRLIEIYFKEEKEEVAADKIANFLIYEKPSVESDNKESLKEIFYLTAKSETKKLVKALLLDKLVSLYSKGFEFELHSRKTVDLLSPTFTIPQVLAWSYFAITINESIFRRISNIDKLSEQQWEALVAGLRCFDSPTLDLSTNAFDRLSIEQLAMLFNGLRKGSSFMTLDLHNNDLNRFTASQWKALFTGLAGTGITKLNLSQNRLGMANFNWIDNLKDSGIKELDLSSNDIGSLSIKEMIGINCLNLNRNDFTCFYGKKLIDFMNQLEDSKICRINLYHSGFNDDEVKKIKSIVHKNKIEKLGLSPRGLKNLCLFSLWQHKSAKIERVQQSKKLFFISEETENVELEEVTYDVIKLGYQL